MITLTSSRGIKRDQARLGFIHKNFLPESTAETRPFAVQKPVIVLTARVHPAETPSSIMIEAILEFLINGQDSQAENLLNAF